MRTFAKRVLWSYFSSRAKFLQSYDYQRRMRVDFSGRFVVRHFEWGSTMLDTAKHEDDRLARFGELEPELHDIFRVFIEPHSTVLDIGANAGLHSLFFSNVLLSKAGVGERDKNSAIGEVLAFEAAPQNYRAIVRNLALNSRHCVVPFEWAISDQNGTAQFNVMPESSYWQGCHSLVANEKIANDYQDDVNRIEVRTRTIDDVLAERDSGLPVSFIKVDVEGAEPAVLRGAGETIARHRPVIALEMSPKRVSHLGTRAADFPEILRRGHYQAFAIFKDGSMSEIASIERYIEHGEISPQEQATRSGDMLLVPAERLGRHAND